MNEFMKNFCPSCQYDEEKTIDQGSFQKGMEQFSNSPKALSNSSPLTGLVEQIPRNDDNLLFGLPNDDEIIDQSNRQVSSIFGNNNTPNKKINVINPNEDSTNYKTKKKKDQRWEK